MGTTDAQDEQLTQVDATNHVLGPIDRKRAHESNVYYRTIYVLVINDKNQVLIQKRSQTKDLFPNCWDLSVGGHVSYGSKYRETAVKELQEELGIQVNEADLIFKGEVLVTLPSSHEYFNVFEYKLSSSQKIAINEEEVGQTRWSTIEYIKQSMKDKSLMWYTRPEQIIAALY